MFPKFSSCIFAAEQMEPLQKITQKAEELFLQYGVRSVTMDDMAKALGISKKTLYQYVENKRDLVNKMVENHMEQERQHIKRVHEASSNAIEEVYGMCSELSRYLKSMNPAALYDLQKYYPASWQVIMEYKYSFLYQAFVNNITRGQEEGLYRTDFHTEIIAKMYLVSTDAIFDPRVFQTEGFALSEIYIEHLDYHLRGLVSDKGHEYLEKRKTK